MLRAEDASDAGTSSDGRAGARLPSLLHRPPTGPVARKRGAHLNGRMDDGRVARTTGSSGAQQATDGETDSGADSAVDMANGGDADVEGRARKRPRATATTETIASVDVPPRAAADASHTTGATRELLHAAVTVCTSALGGRMTIGLARPGEILRLFAERGANAPLSFDDIVEHLRTVCGGARHARAWPPWPPGSPLTFGPHNCHRHHRSVRAATMPQHRRRSVGARALVGARAAKASWQPSVSVCAEHVLRTASFAATPSRAIYGG